MKKDKRFVVQSDNHNLIHAFRKECEAKNIPFRYSFSSRRLIVNAPENKFIDLAGKTDYFYYSLPDQWNQAIEALDSIVQPEYKVNDWVIYDNRIYQIIDIQRLHAKIIRKEEVAQLIQIKDIERHATQEEIKQHLLSLTDIKEGDLVKDIRLTDRTYEVKKIMLSSEADPKPGNTSYKYYSENGDHLVMTDNKNNCIPLDQCEKVDDLSIETIEGKTYKPEFVSSQVIYGCISIDKDTLKSFSRIMSFCATNNIVLGINEEGFISFLSAEGGTINKIIAIDDIHKLIDKLK